MTRHRWSGWPGAWCLDCGQPDANELCVNEHNVGITCVNGHVQCMDGCAMAVCTVHVNGPCPEPGSKRNDPYGMKISGAE